MRKLTQEEVIKRIIEVHHDKYDLSKMVYKNKRTKVEVICKKHGSFLSHLEQLLRGQGCPTCYKEKPRKGLRLTQEQFIERSIEIHGGKYDYSKVEHINNRKKVIIICNIHGEFKQSPGSHFSGSGCPVCGRESQTEKRKFTTKEFIEDARDVHGDRYDYSKVKYINSRTNVTIICKEHGEFYPRPGNHIGRESGCPECSIIETHEDQKKTLEEFIQDSKNVHGDRYDYSKVIYINSKTKVTVMCREHGEFYPTPNLHQRGTGCPQCSLLEQSQRQTKTLEGFIEDSIEVHGDLYDYSLVDYVNTETKVTVRCKKHDELFYPIPNNHLRGSGCPECKTDKLTKSLEEFIEDSREIHGDLYDYSKVDYENGEESVIIICEKHGEFLQKPKIHTGGGGCQKCSYSKGELQISKYLKEHNVEFIPQFIFDDLSFKRKLRCDFYLNVRNIVIEYNGEQHYKPNSFFGGEEGFKKVQQSDKLKENYCKEKGIDFEVIRFDEDVEERLTEIIKP